MFHLGQKWRSTNRIIGLALVILALLFGTAPMHAQATADELTYIQKSSQNYVIGTLVSGDQATVVIRMNEQTHHVPLRQGVLYAYGVSRGWFAFTAKSETAQEEFFVTDIVGGTPVPVLTADRVLRASWRPGHSAIAVAYKLGKATRLAVYDIEAHSLKQVDPIESEKPFLFWSRDGVLNYVTSGSGDATSQSYDAELNAPSPELNAPSPKLMNPEYIENTPSTREPQPGNLDGNNNATDDDTVLVNFEGTGASTDFRTPLILIHGIEGGTVNWKNGVQQASTDTWDNFIYNTYYQSYNLTHTYRLYLFIYQSDKHPVDSIARSLRNHIDEALHANTIADVPFVLLAHSMGGLIARDYMSFYPTDQTSSNPKLASQYKGLEGGDRTLKLITLGTPHHGTPIANGPSRNILLENADRRDPFLPGVNWVATAYTMQKAGTWLGYTTASNVPNLDDLWWDNVDNAMDNSANDIQSIVSILNINKTYDYKISAFYGYYDGALNSDFAAAVANVYSFPGSAQRLPYKTNTTLALGVIMTHGLADSLGGVLYPRTDGYVPNVSAFFQDHTVDEVVECPGYNHVDLHNGVGDTRKCKATGRFDSTDVLNAITERLAFIRPLGDTPASMLSPYPEPWDDTLPGSSVKFTWDLGSGVDEVELDVGTASGQKDIFTKWEGIHASDTVTGLPTNGQKIYVTLRSKIGVNWQQTPYTYTASGLSATSKLIISPSSGLSFGSQTVNSSTSLPLVVQNTGSVPFHITSKPTINGGGGTFALVSPTNYPVTVAANGSISLTIGFTPTDNSSSSATLVIPNDSTNAAPSVVVSLSGSGGATSTLPPVPVLIYPGSSTAPGQQISSTTPTFQWMKSTGATSYGLYISVAPYGQINLLNPGWQISGTETSFPIPAGILKAGVQYAWNMSATNSAGQNCCSKPAYYFQVTSTASPTITSIGPPNLSTSSASQQLTITGTGLSTISQLSFGAPGTGTIIITSSSFIGSSATSITVPIVLNTAGTWTVTAITSSSQSSNSLPFTVTAPAQNPGAFQLSANAPTCKPAPSTAPLVSIYWTASTQAATYYVYRNSFLATALTSDTLNWTDPATLAAGTSYTYYVVAGNGQGTIQSNSVPVSIPANVCYSQPAGNIVLSSSTFNSFFNQGAPQGSAGLLIKDDSGKPMLGTISVSTQSGGNWLTFNGYASYTWNAPETVMLTYNPAGLPPALYTGSITISSPQASNSPLTFPVTMLVSPVLAITTPAALPDAFAGQPYSVQLQATGGSGLAWTLAGGTFPTGLSLNQSAGVISGTPAGVTSTTQETVNIGVSDSLGRQALQAFTINWRQGIVISPPLGGWTPVWILGQPVLSVPGYNFTVSGGTPPYQWSATGLPPGVGIDPNTGYLSGSPTSAGSYPVVISVIDSAGLKGSLSITFSVVQHPVQIHSDSNKTPPSLDSGVSGTAYTMYLTADGGTQTGFKWSTSGSLPPGITAGPSPGCTGSHCDATLFFSGTPTATGIYPFTVSVTDSGGNGVSNYVVLVVNKPGAAPTISQAALPTATIGSAYSYALAATGGTGAIQWKLLGPLPEQSLAVSPVGALAVTPTLPNDCWVGPSQYLPPGFPASKVFFVEALDTVGQADVEQFCVPAYFIKPTISDIVPSDVITDGTDKTITIVGTGFQQGSLLQVGSYYAQTPIFVSSTELQFVLSASGNFIQKWPPSTYPVRVSAPYTPISDAATFAIDLPPVVISSASGLYLGSPNTPCISNWACQMNITGSGFSPYTQFQVDGTSQSISYLSTTSTTVPWSQVTTSNFTVTTSGTHSMQLTNPSQPGGGTSSATVSFQVYSLLTIVPTPSSISKQATQGDSASNMSLMVATAGGSGFPGTATVSGGSWLKVNGQASASWTSPATLSVTIDPTGLASGTFNASIKLTSSQSPNSGLVVPVTLVVSSSLQITTSSLPDAYSGTPYNATLQAAGGSGLSWQLQSSQLPPGLSLNSTTGVISGTPGPTSVVVPRVITFMLGDSLLRTATQTLTINWKPGITIAVPSTGIPQWVVGTAIQNVAGYNFTASGGTAPYSWSATGLPAGVSLSPGGILSGTPTAAGTSTAVFSVTDSLGLQGSFSVPLQVTQLPLKAVDNSFGNDPPVAPNGTLGVAYPSLFMSGSGGSQTGYRWTITGTLPPGITAAPPPGCTPPDCAIGFIGTPTMAGSYPVTLQLTDSANDQMSVNLAFAISPGAPAITFTVPNHTYGDAPFTISATSNSSGAITYSVVSGSAMIAGSTVTLTGTGTVVLQASQAASDAYSSGTQTATFTVATGAPTITFTVLNHTYGDAPFTVSATSNSSGAITYSVVSGPATISGSIMTLTGVGTVVLQASQAASGNYTAGIQTATFTVATGAPTIAFTVSNHTYGDAPFVVSATSNSSGAITYSVVSGPATIAGSTVTLTGAGTVVLQASQAAAGNYTLGTQTAAFTVAGNAPTISFTVPNHSYGDAPFTVAATSNSSGVITYSLVSGPATISGSTVTLTGAGTVVLQASQVAAGNYAAGTQTATFTVAGNAPTISFSVPNHTYGDAPFTVSATSNSTGAFTYSVVSGPVTVSGSTVTLTGAGTVVLQASQTAAGNYTLGTQTAAFTVTAESQTITFSAPASPVNYGVAPISLSASASSVLAVTFSVISGPGSVSGSTLTITGAGTVVIAANQAGNANFAAAAQVTQSIVVNQATQTITFTAPTSPVTYGVSPITLVATGGASGNAVVFSVVSGPATVSGSTLTITGGGIVMVAANQAGNANYSAATQVTQSIVVNVIGAATTPTFSPAAGTYTTAQTVSISDATTGATIYYTTNGTTPTTSSSVYSGAISVSSTETLEAIATATGYATSAVASSTYTISIPTNPVPAISGVSPAFTNAGGTVFTLTVNGSGFIASSTAYWGTSALTTTYVSATQLTAQVPSADIATVGTISITVQTPAPGGGTSNAWQFEVDTASSGTTGPTITSTTETVAAGSTASYPVTVPSSGTNVSVTCLNLPTGATCSYSSTTNSVTIATSLTTPKGTYQIIVVFTETVTTTAFLLPILLLPLGFMRRKLAARGIWLTACLGLVLLASAPLISGCGGGSSGGSGSTTPPSTHQVTSSGAVSLTIQ